MNTLTKTAFASVLALGAFTAATPAIAGDAGQDGIVVQSKAAMEEWSQDVTRSLNRAIFRSERLWHTPAQSGIVQLRFTLDENGRPENISLYRSSGHSSTDKIASRAVRKLATLGDAPVRDASSKLFQANIIFAADPEQLASFETKLEKLEAARIASSAAEASVVTLGG